MRLFVHGVLLSVYEYALFFFFFFKSVLHRDYSVCYSCLFSNSVCMYRVNILCCVVCVRGLMEASVH